jgi:hypothetical protein
MTISLTINIWELLIAAPILLMYITWVFFTAVMRLRELRDARILTNQSNPVVWALSLFTLVCGLVLDALLRFTVCLVVGMEIPPVTWHKVWKLNIPLPEMLTTFTLCRWYESPPGNWWNEKVRRPFAHFGALLLNMVDTNGKHIY